MTRIRLFWAIIILPGIGGPALAQWTADSVENTRLGDWPGTEWNAQIVTNPDDSAYCGWTFEKNGKFILYLQHLAADGTELWPHGGIPVAEVAYRSSFDLISDSEGNAIVAPSPGNIDFPRITIFKIAPDRTFLWSDEGISLTEGTHQDRKTILVEADNGDIVALWNRGNSSAEYHLRMQRLSSQGEPLLPQDGVVVSEPSDPFPTDYLMAPTSESGVLLAFSANASPLTGYLHFKVQRFDPSGMPVWPDYLTLFQDESLIPNYGFQMVSDGQGGAFLAWPLPTWPIWSVQAQHVTSNGAFTFPGDGVSVSQDIVHSHNLADIVFSPDSGELTVLFTQYDVSLEIGGIHGQRLDFEGNLLWGPQGREILPVDNVDDWPVHCVAHGDKIIGLCIRREQDTLWQDHIVGFQIDGDGAMTWSPSIVGVATMFSGKADLRVTGDSGGGAIAIWIDNRWSTLNIFGQNINHDGTLGPLVVPVPEVSSDFQVQVFPNPFNPRTTISFLLNEPATVKLAVFDLNGHLVRRIDAGSMEPGPRAIEWDGTDHHGRQSASGTYLVVVRAGDRLAETKVMLVQ